jgi:predicted dehydrogenase
MNNKAKLRWGILGAARINQQLMPAIVEAENSELVAIASRRSGAAAETLARYAPDQQNVRIYDQLDALLDDADIQAIYLPLSNNEHAQWTLRAIERGKHVLCEKPLALTVADIEAIEVAANKHNVSVMEGFMYRYHPQHAQIKQLIASGLIGEVRSVRSCFSFMMQPARLYRLAENIENGGGAMWDIGCYAINAARLPWLNESPLAVTALAKYTDTGADISSSGIIDFGDGKYAQFDFSFERARRAEYEIIGTRGGIKCHNVWAKQSEMPVLSWWTESGQQCTESLLPANHFRLEIEHFSDCVLNAKKPGISLQDSKNNCRVIAAALQSAARGQRVLLN